MSSVPESSDRFRHLPAMLAIGLLISVSILFGLYNAILLLNRGIAPTEPLRRVLSNEMVAPDFTLTAQDGRAFHLADYKGRAVFLAFVPRLDDTNSTTLIRSLKTSVGDFDRAGAKVFVVSPEPKETAQAFYQREKLPFPILHDAEGRVRMQYTIPEGRRTTFVVDPVGKVRYRIGDAMIEAERHGKQLLDISKCCMDDIIAARAGGIGKPVGDYSLPRAESGQMETLYGDGTQKATVIAFISVKCPCSNTYNDRLRTIAAEYSKQGVRFVGVYANSDESAKEIATHATEQRFPFIALRDERGLCADHFRAAVTPQVFVIDSQRILRYGGRIDDNREETAVTAEDLRDALEAVLKGGTVPEETLPFGCAIVRDTLADDKPSTTERPAGNE